MKHVHPLSLAFVWALQGALTSCTPSLDVGDQAQVPDAGSPATDVYLATADAPGSAPPPAACPGGNGNLPARVLWLKLDGSARDEVSGREGMVEGLPIAWDEGRFDRSLELTGAENLSFGVSDAWRTLEEVQQVTMSAWIFVEALQPGYLGIITQSAPNSAVETVGLFLKDGFPTITVDFLGVSTPAPVPLGSWVHVAGVYADRSLEVYVNGQPVAQQPTPFGIGSVDPEPILVGANRNKGVVGERFSGRIDEISVFARALSAAEIQALSCRP